MKNIELSLAKPYNRDETKITPHKINLSIEFDAIDEALAFLRELNLLVIRFNAKGNNNG